MPGNRQHGGEPGSSCSVLGAASRTRPTHSSAPAAGTSCCVRAARSAGAADARPTTTLNLAAMVPTPPTTEPAEIVTDSEAGPPSRRCRWVGAARGQAWAQRRQPLPARPRSDVTAGRHPDSDIFLDDVTVSRRHAEFRRTPEGGFTVVDVGSLNGTYLKRGRIETAMLLSSGDEVQVGKFRLTFLAAPPRPAMTQPTRRRRPDPRAGSVRRRVDARALRRADGPPSSRSADDLAPAPTARRRRADDRRGAGALRADFPELTICKIRYYERQGLLRPARSAAGYRKFSAGRRRPAALHPHRGARPVPAAEGHQGAARGR